ncbi:collagen alpha-1(III) chain-like [Melospiza melodia melodia]|uniref:collagen alpha-1(III) chain-like n=1 Tax=Melospiza melodia melodia TaxID=1914991 RepID=UPI002FD0A337
MKPALNCEQNEIKLGRKLCKPLGFNPAPFEINVNIPIVLRRSLQKKNQGEARLILQPRRPFLSPGSSLQRCRGGAGCAGPGPPQCRPHPGAVGPPGQNRRFSRSQRGEAPREAGEAARGQRESMRGDGSGCGRRLRPLKVPQSRPRRGGAGPAGAAPPPLPRGARPGLPRQGRARGGALRAGPGRAGRRRRAGGAAAPDTPGRERGGGGREGAALPPPPANASRRR